MPHKTTEALRIHWRVFHQINLIKLCKIVLALPMSTSRAKVNHVFLKKYYDLSNLGVLSVEPRMARAINLYDFVDVFA